MTPALHHIPLVMLALAVFMLLGCRSEITQPNNSDTDSMSSATSGDRNATDETNVAKVKVLADGTMLLNDKHVTIDELKTAFTELKNNNGVVWYYRENADGEPPPQAILVIQAVVDAELPIKLSTKPDFSDSVGPDGN